MRHLELYWPGMVEGSYLLGGSIIILRLSLLGQAFVHNGGFRTLTLLISFDGGLEFLLGSVLLVVLGWVGRSACWYVGICWELGGELSSDVGVGGCGVVGGVGSNSVGGGLGALLLKKEDHLILLFDLFAGFFKLNFQSFDSFVFLLVFEDEVLFFPHEGGFWFLDLFFFLFLFFEDLGHIFEFFFLFQYFLAVGIASAISFGQFFFKLSNFLFKFDDMFSIFLLLFFKRGDLTADTFLVFDGWADDCFFVFYFAS